MKTHFKLLLLFIMSFLAFGQENAGFTNARDEKSLIWDQERRAARNSDYMDTFAVAFNDPNVLIGVFEPPKYVPNVLPSTTLSSGKILEELPGYGDALLHFNYSYFIQLRCIKSIKGEFNEPMVFLITPPIYRSLRDDNIPAFIVHEQTKWILALRKTTQEYRVARLGQEVEKYAFLNDDTVFSLFHWGHGSLCLQWPDKIRKPDDMIEVSADVIQEFEAIEKAMPHIQKKQREPSDTVAIEKTKAALKTNKAKAIFDELLLEQEKPKP